MGMSHKRNMKTRLVLASMILPLFLIGCAEAQPGDRPETPGFDLQGHRGARGLLPENTIPAFLRALELGVTTLELDVVIAKDATVVVSSSAAARAPRGHAAVCSPRGSGRQTPPSPASPSPRAL